MAWTPTAGGMSTSRRAPPTTVHARARSAASASSPHTHWESTWLRSQRASSRSSQRHTGLDSGSAARQAPAPSGREGRGASAPDIVSSGRTPTPPCGARGGVDAASGSSGSQPAAQSHCSGSGGGKAANTRPPPAAAGASSSSSVCPVCLLAKTWRGRLHASRATDPLSIVLAAPHPRPCATPRANAHANSRATQAHAPIFSLRTPARTCARATSARRAAPLARGRRVPCAYPCNRAPCSSSPHAVHAPARACVRPRPRPRRHRRASPLRLHRSCAARVPLAGCAEAHPSPSRSRPCLGSSQICCRVPVTQIFARMRGALGCGAADPGHTRDCHSSTRQLAAAPPHCPGAGGDGEAAGTRPPPPEA